MKFTIKARQRKFLAGMVLYGLLVLIIYLLPRRYELFGLACLGFLSFLTALYAIHKPLVTVILVATLMLAPMQGRCQSSDPPGDGDKNMIIGCLVIVIGGAIFYGLYKVCEKIQLPGEEPPPPPPCTGCPVNTNFNWVHHIIYTRPGLQMPDKALNVSTNWQSFTLAVESSRDSITWQREVYVTNWVDRGMHVAVTADSAGNPLQTNWTAIGWTNDTVGVDLSGVWSPSTNDRVRLWRMADLR